MFDSRDPRWRWFVWLLRMASAYRLVRGLVREIFDHFH